MWNVISVSNVVMLSVIKGRQQKKISKTKICIIQTLDQLKRSWDDGFVHRNEPHDLEHRMLNN
jgi:hypothetical protein